MGEGEADAAGTAGDEDVARFDWDGDVARADEEEESEEEKEWEEEEREEEERCVHGRSFVFRVCVVVCIDLILYSTTESPSFWVFEVANRSVVQIGNLRFFLLTFWVI